MRELFLILLIPGVTLQRQNKSTCSYACLPAEHENISRVTVCDTVFLFIQILFTTLKYPLAYPIYIQYTQSIFLKISIKIQIQLYFPFNKILTVKLHSMTELYNRSNKMNDNHFYINCHFSSKIIVIHQITIQLILAKVHFSNNSDSHFNIIINYPHQLPKITAYIDVLQNT